MLFEEAYQTHWARASPSCATTTSSTITGSGFDFRTESRSAPITMFRLVDGQWRRADAEIRERCYTRRRDRPRARTAPASARSLCYDARDLGMGGQLGEGRTFYVATKRASRGSRS